MLPALGLTVLALGVLGEDGIHVVPDAVTALVTDAPDPIQSGDQCVASVGRQGVRGRQSLFKHSHQGIEVAFVLIAEVARKTGGLLAIEDHQLGQAGGVADGLLVIGNGLAFRTDGTCLLKASGQSQRSIVSL